MKRFFTVLTVLCLLGQAAEMTDAEWAALKKAALERPRPIIYDNDGDDFSYHRGELSVEALLAKRTTWLCNYPISTIAFCVNGSCFQMKMPTVNGEPEVCEWPPEDDGKGSKVEVLNGVQWCLDHGVDILQLEIDYAHEHGMEIFAEFRFNDIHDSYGTVEEPYPPYFSKFKRQHPELTVGSLEKRPPYGAWTAYDFTHKELRDRYAALMVEVAEKYDIDGISIDFYRRPHLFKSVAWGAEASAEEVALFSEMFRRIRAGTEAAGRRRGRPVLLAVRCPDSVGFCRAIGFDWEGLMAEGAIDIVFPAGDKHFQPWSKSVELCHRYGVKCYPSIDYATFSHDPVVGKRREEECYHARIAAAYLAGADGIYYFNLFKEWNVQNLMAPNPEAVRLKDKRYYFTERVLGSLTGQLRTAADYNFFPELYNGVNSTLLPVHPLTFRLECGDDMAALAADGVTPRLQATLVAQGDPAVVQFTSNGVAWKYTASRGERHFYTAPPEALQPGVNEFTFTAVAKSDSVVEREILRGDAILQGANQPPWRRAFPLPPENDDNERIVDGAYRIDDNGKGRPSLVYPLSREGASAIDCVFEAKTEGECDELGAVMRAVGGGHVEIVTFCQGRVGFHFAQKSVPFDTGVFHRYRLRLSGGVVTLEADGRELLQAKAAAITDEMTHLADMECLATEINERSLIIGSLDDAGRGVSHWRHVKLRQPKESVLLKDFWVDVKLAPPSE